MPLLAGLPETRGAVDRARGDQVALRPEHHLPVARLPGKADAFLDQSSAQAEPPPFGLDEKQPQPREALRSAHEEDAADPFAFALGDEGPLGSRIVLLQEGACDLRHESLEADVPSVLACVEGAVALHPPADVAGTVPAQRPRIRGGLERRRLPAE